MSVGEDRVRIGFNPSDEPMVDDFKLATASLINMCNAGLTATAEPEEKRLWSLAMTHYEDAAMWAVKASTYQQAMQQQRQHGEENRSSDDPNQG